MKNYWIKIIHKSGSMKPKSKKNKNMKYKYMVFIEFVLFISTLWGIATETVKKIVQLGFLKEVPRTFFLAH